MLKRFVMTLLALSVFTPDLVSQDKMPQGNLVRSSQLIGMQLKDSAGQTVGELKDVVFDRTQGTIAFAVASFNDVAAAGDKFFAVPWEALKSGGDQAALTLNLSKDRLDKAPGFDKNQWPDFADVTKANEIRTFYGTTAAPRRAGSRACPCSPSRRAT